LLCSGPFAHINKVKWNLASNCLRGIGTGSWVSWGIIGSAFPFSPLVKIYRTQMVRTGKVQ
jgi:hypothetical protein